MLLRIDENVEIDMSYITCAEYQLFIDEKLKAGEHRQPDHWTTDRFPPGDAKKPITGIRARDAEEFCEWLNQQNSVLRFRYRLPTLIEVEEHPVTEKQVGCWCWDREQLIVAGIETGQRQSWQQKLAEVLILNTNLNRVLNCDLNCDLNCVLNRDLNCVLNCVLNRDLNCVLNCVLNRDIYRVLYRDIYRVLYRDIYLDRNSDRNRNLVLNLDLNSDIYLDRNSDIYRALNSDIYRVLNCDLNRVLSSDLNFNPNHKIESNEDSNFLLLYLPLMFLIVLFHLLSEIYRGVLKDKQVLEAIGLSHQECEAISYKYANTRDNIFPLYTFLVLLDERHAERIPACEGIRIVRERI